MTPLPFSCANPFTRTNAAVKPQKISADWNCPVVIAATGPSLTAEVAAKVRRARWPDEKCRVIAVNDAYRLLPYADILYACDASWWTIHGPDVKSSFHGERWSTLQPKATDKVAAEYELNLVAGEHGSLFSSDPGLIRYGSNSGFQALNLALLKGATRVVLVGYDMRVIGKQRHFFGDHPKGLSNATIYTNFIPHFVRAAKDCKVPIVNATPGSALPCWPKKSLDEALGEL